MPIGVPSLTLTSDLSRVFNLLVTDLRQCRAWGIVETDALATRDADLWDLISPSVLPSTGRVRVVQRQVLVPGLRLVTGFKGRHLWHHWDAASPWVNIAPLFLAPTGWIVNLAIWVAAFVPCLATTTKIGWILDLFFADLHQGVPLNPIETHARALLIARGLLDLVITANLADALF